MKTAELGMRRVKTEKLKHPSIPIVQRPWVPAPVDIHTLFAMLGGRQPLEVPVAPPHGNDPHPPVRLLYSECHNPQSCPFPL
jgi:hypothetical protein